MKELKEGVLNGFHNESRVKNKSAFWQQVQSDVSIIIYYNIII
jgi:hypothetical protein